MGYLKNETLSTTYKRFLFVGGSSDNAGLTGSLKSVGTDDGGGSINTAPFTMATGELNFSSNKLSFHDTAVYIQSPSDTNLNIVADGEVDVTSATVDVNATGAVAIDSSGSTITLTSSGSTTLASATTVSGALTCSSTASHAGAVTMASGVKMQFVDANEYISGDSSNMTVGSSGRIDLTATSDVRIPTDVGLQFVGTANYIEYAASGAQLKVVSGGALNQTAGAASTIKTTAGNLTVDSEAATLTLDGHTGVDIDASNSGAVSIDGAGGINLGTNADVAFDVDTAAFDMDSSGAITIDGTSTIGIGTGANAGAISIGTNATARTVTVGNKIGASSLVLSSGTGKIDVGSTGEIEFTSTKNAASSIYMRANGGTSETIKIHADRGTGVGSIELTSDAGGIDINAGTGMTINTADTATFLMAANSGSAKYFSMDATNAGGGAAGVKVGTTSGTTVTIGHTTSETTVSDNLTVTGNLTVGGTQAYTDLAISDTSPTLTSSNTTEENGDGGRESIWYFKGEKGDGTSTTIAQIRADHQGSSDDYKGELFFKVNTDSSADGQSTALKITSDLKSTFSGNVDIDAALDVDGGSFTFNEASGDYDFRCESNNNTHMIFMDAGNDRLGVKESSPSTTLQVGGNVAFGTGGELTISSGVVTSTHSYHTVDTESDASTDDLDTINGGVVAGQIIVLKAENTARSIVAKDGTGNLKLSGDFTMDNTEDTLMLVYDGSNWLEVTRSNNGS